MTMVFDMLSRTQVMLSCRSGAKLPLYRHGEGTQSMAVLFLFDAFLRARITEDYDDDAEPILALEEPEAHLHSSAIRSLGILLQDLKGQRVIATHSGDLLASVPLKCIRRLARKNGKIECFRLKEGTLAEDIASRKPDQRLNCAILSRTRKVLDTFIRALEESGLEGYLSIRKDEFATAPMRWLHGMLRLANSRQDREQLRRVCKAFYTLEGINLDVRDIISYASSEEGDYLRAWRQAVLNRSELTKQTKDLIENEVVELSDKLDFNAFITSAFQWFENLEAPGPEADISRDEEYINEKDVWQELVREITAQYGRKSITLHLLLQELDLRSKAPVPNEGAIPCFTIHASKGMEFGHVYLTALVEDQLPSWAATKKGDDSREMQEERRNCFVAVTRAQKSLTLTYANRVFGWTKEPSRFLSEMNLV
jgi:DNA helicase-2/ATP-dependent DNA helicase PcrA